MSKNENPQVHIKTNSKKVAEHLTETLITFLSFRAEHDIKNTADTCKTYESGFVAALSVLGLPEDVIQKVVQYHRLNIDEIENNIKNHGCSCGECHNDTDNE